MNTQRFGFTLVELLIAMAVGLVVILITMTAMRTVVQTVTLANSWSLENKLMRNGVQEALDELDYWTLYDDPLEPAEQRLRTVTTMPAAAARAKVEQFFGGGGEIAGLEVKPNDTLTTQPNVLSRLRLGMAFTPLSRFPAPLTNDFGALSEQGQTVEIKVRPVEKSPTTYVGMLLAPAASLADDRSQVDGHAYELDRDRGFDPLRPYQANDPRRWYRGNMYESPHTDQRFGRYGMLMNLWQQPMLGYGSDPREIMSFGRTTAAYPAGNQAVTGPYGPYPMGDYEASGLQSRTWTWYCNQVVFLWEALGSYGLAEYVPSGSIIRSYGARAYHPFPAPDPLAPLDPPKPEYSDGYLVGVNDPQGPTIRRTVRDSTRPDDNYMRMDERQDYRFSGYPCYWGYTGNYYDYISLNGSHTPRPGTTWDATKDATLPLIPLTDFTGAKIVGAPTGGWRWEYILGDSSSYSLPNTTFRPEVWQLFHRMPWSGLHFGGPLTRPLENRSQIVRPLLFQKPSIWPDLSMSVQRAIQNGRFMSIAQVRWTDPVTTEVSELDVTSIATTLRGARQQRHRDQGWAAFFGVNDPRNDPTLDSP